MPTQTGPRSKQKLAPENGRRTVDAETMRLVLEPVMASFEQMFRDLNEKQAASDAKIDARHEENRKRHHDDRDAVQLVVDKQYLAINSVSDNVKRVSSDLEIVKTRLQAIDGGSPGSGGTLKKIEEGQSRLETQFSEMRSDLRSLKEARDPQEETRMVSRLEQSNAFQNQWIGVRNALMILVPLCVLLGMLFTAAMYLKR